MRSKLTTMMTVIGAVVILAVAGNGIALAATGQGFVLGHNNYSGALSTLTRTTSGPALKLHTTSTSAAPMQVNGHGKVTNLNADLLDGLDSSTIRNHSWVFTKTISSAVGSVQVPLSVGNGTYHFDYSAFLQGAQGGTWAYCEMREDNGSSTNFVAITQIAPPATVAPGLAGSGVITKKTGDSLSLQCGASNDFTASYPIQVVLTPTSVVSTTVVP